MSYRHITTIAKRPSVYGPERKMSRDLRNRRVNIGFDYINKEVREANFSNDMSQQWNTNDESQEDSSDLELESTEDALEQIDASRSNRETGVPYIRVILGIIFAVAVLYFSVVLYFSQFKNVDSYSKLEEWQQFTINLEKNFPSQNTAIWSTFYSGIKSIVMENPVKPSVFLILYDDEKTSTCLVHKIGQEAAKFLSETSEEPIIIKGEDLKRNVSLLQDYGRFTETYKDDIKRKHVMIVLNLQEIPAVLAQTFHSLCDVYNPVVQEAAYLFTMHVDRNSKNHPTKVAEKALRTLWNGLLDIDIMEPLIIRITDTVLFLNSEDNIPC